MAVVGAIADRVKGIMPITWDALTKDSRYGEDLMRETIDAVKYRVTGSVVQPANESSYPLVVIEYLAKLTAIELINPAIDFWMTQPVSTTTTGTSEDVSYPSRTTELRNLRVSLLADVKRLEPEVIPLLDYKRISRAPRASSSTQNDPFLTPSPQEFPRPYGPTTYS